MGELFYQFHPTFKDQMYKDKPIAFLDRDGVINVGFDTYVNSPEELELIPGAAQAIGHLKQAGFGICVVTNQSPIERGLWNHHRLNAIHEEMLKQIEHIQPNAIIDLLLACPHKHSSRCKCRKPEPTMLHYGSYLLRNAELFEEKHQSYGMTMNHLNHYSSTNWFGNKPQPIHRFDAMVGDRLSDLGAGWGYGARTYFVNENQSLFAISSRVIDLSDEGDHFSPVN